MGIPSWRNSYTSDKDFELACAKFASDGLLIKERQDLALCIEDPALFSYLAKRKFGLGTPHPKLTYLYEAFKCSYLLEIFRGIIYRIRCIKNGCEYIGKTESKSDYNFDGSNVYTLSRIRSHIFDLNGNKHTLDFLQEDWNTYGSSNFAVTVEHDNCPPLGLTLDG